LPEETQKISYSRIARRIRVPLGFAFAAVFLWLATPTWYSLAIGACIVVPGLLTRALAAGHVKKNRELTTTGPYGHTRNPLYLGSILIAVGFAIASRNYVIGALLVVMFLAIYLPVIRDEEKFLQSTFTNFDEYRSRVPRLFPRFTNAYGRGEGFSRERYMHHREYNALIGSALLFVALIAKILYQK
jgi:protein-S-isoprenylcysteine O-methyltransferase Ste14